MNEKGITIIEILVVMALISIILLVTIPFTLSQIRKARGESETRTLYGNLTEARQRGLERNRPYIVEVTKTAINVFEDTDRDGTADAAEKVTVLSADKLAYDLDGVVGSVTISATAEQVVVNTRGIMLPTASIRLKSASTSDDGATLANVNCIEVATTRISLGKLKSDGVTCEIQ